MTTLLERLRRHDNDLAECYSELYLNDPVEEPDLSSGTRLSITTDNSLVSPYERRLDKEGILWIDIETTGLDPEIHDILEVAVIVTDFSGNVVGDGYLMTSSESDLNWSELALQMHEKSGLLSDLEEFHSTGNHQDVVDMIKCLSSFFEDDYRNSLYVGGRGPHFDKRFLDTECLYYRHMDMRSIEKFHSILGIETKYSSRFHRAYVDIVECVLNYNHFLNERS